MLQTFEAMEGRVKLQHHEQRTFETLRHGYQGERTFAAALEKYLTKDVEKLFDLTLNIGGSVTQLDSLLFFQNEIYHFEVKYMKGNYLFEQDRWYYTANQKEIRNPLHQLSRANLLLQEFLRKQKVSIKIKSYLVFVHPNFFLYQAPQNQALIFPNQLKQFITQLENIPNLPAKQTGSKQLLMEAHQEKNPFEKVPIHPYESFIKGLICKKCRRVMQRSTTRTWKCSDCQSTEELQSAVWRSIKEFGILFPESKITVDEIYHWCGKTVSKSCIRGVLKRNMEMMLNGRYSSYQSKW